MTSRERLIATLNHQQPDKVVLDLGATSQTGINASTLYQLRQALGLDQHPIEISEIGQMLGRVELDVLLFVQTSFPSSETCDVHIQKLDESFHSNSLLYQQVQVLP